MKSLSYYICELNRLSGTSTVKWAIECNGTISACDYFKSTMFALVILLVGLAVMVVLGGACIWLFTAPIIGAFSGLTGIMFSWYDYELAMAMTLSIMIVITIFAGGMFCNGAIKFWPKWFPVGKWATEVYYKLRGETVKKEEKEKEPGIISIWYSSAKNKFCPNIDFSKHGKE